MGTDSDSRNPWDSCRNSATAEREVWEMSILTKQQKHEYLKVNYANLCPFCKSPDITGGSIDIDGRTGAQDVSCNECGEEWIDLYQLSGVATADEYKTREAINEDIR
jgi:hypothetical protein